MNEMEEINPNQEELKIFLKNMPMKMIIKNT